MGGLGETDVSIVRKLAPQAEQEAEESAASITPEPSGPSESDQPRRDESESPASPTPTS